MKERKMHYITYYVYPGTTKITPKIYCHSGGNLHATSNINHVTCKQCLKAINNKQ